MFSLKTLFYRYLEDDSQEAIIADLVKKRLQSNPSFLHKNKDELIFLYRQARIYNIESKINFIGRTEAYQNKRLKIIRFFKMIVFEDISFSSFEYNEDKDEFVFRSFLIFLVVLALEDEQLIEDFLDQTFYLLDPESASEFCLHYVHIAKEDNKKIPEIIKIVLKTNVNETQYNHYFEYMNNNLYSFKTDEAIKFRYYLAFEILNCINFCFTNKSKGFLLLAYELNESLSFSTFSDFSIVSLQYYKVIEVELKDKFIRPIFEKINWGKFYYGKRYCLMSDFNYNLFTIGDICIIFDEAICYFTNRNIKSIEKTNQKFYKELFRLLNNKIDYLIFMRDIISEPFRNLYRNPPAHTEPLQKDHIDDLKNLFYAFVGNYRKIYLKIDEPPLVSQTVLKILKNKTNR